MGPFKCPECGVWWAGFEHRCPPPAPNSSTIGIYPSGGTFTVRCTCPDPTAIVKGAIAVGCPIHDVQTMFTTTPLS